MIIRNYFVPFVAMNKLVKTFDWLHHHSTPEELLHQSNAHMIFTMIEQPVDPLVTIQWNKN